MSTFPTGRALIRFDRVNRQVYTVNMTNDDRQARIELRRRWLNLGMDGLTLARERGITKQAVWAAIKRLNASDPLVYRDCDPLDQAALDRCARILLERRGIRFRTALAPAADVPRPATNLPGK